MNMQVVTWQSILRLGSRDALQVITLDDPHSHKSLTRLSPPVCFMERWAPYS
jgi:hypothetical protein